MEDYARAAFKTIFSYQLDCEVDLHFDYSQPTVNKLSRENMKETN